MKELIAKRTRVFEEGRAILLKAETEVRALTSEEQTKYDAITADVKAMGETLNRYNESEKTERELSRSIGPRETLPGGRRSASQDLVDAGMVAFLRGGRNELTAEQRGIYSAVPGHGDSLQFRTTPTALSVTTPTAGVETVPAGFVNNLEKALLAYNGVRQAGATILRTATGNPLPWPTTNDTNNTGEIIGENTLVNGAATEMVFGSVTFNAFKYSSKLVLVPIELLQDSAFDIQAHVADALGTRIGRKQNTDFTTGAGTTLPKGIIVASSSGLTTASTTAITYDEITDLEHSVDPAYRVGAKFMLNDTTAALLEKLKDGNGRPLLNGTMAGISEGVSAGSMYRVVSIKGYPVVVNTAMAAATAALKPMAFGDFSKYVVRDCLDIMLVRFGEKYMDQGQIGFLCFMRSDANLVDAGTHPVKYLTMHA